MDQILPFLKKNLPKQWMVVYTRSNCEKKAHKTLNDQGITSFCPLIKTKKKWADRNKIIDVPLFNSYLFVQVSSQEQSKVQQIPGVVNFVQYCGKPVSIADDEITKIKTFVSSYSDLRAITNSNFSIGDKIKVNEGPLADLEGEVVQLQGASVIMVMKELGCVLVVKVNQNNVYRYA